MSTIVERLREIEHLQDRLEAETHAYRQLLTETCAPLPIGWRWVSVSHTTSRVMLGGAAVTMLECGSIVVDTEHRLVIPPSVIDAMRTEMERVTL